MAARFGWPSNVSTGLTIRSRWLFILPLVGTINLTLPEGNIALQSVSIAAGRFAGSGHDQIVIAYAGVADNTTKLITVNYGNQGEIKDLQDCL